MDMCMWIPFTSKLLMFTPTTSPTQDDDKSEHVDTFLASVWLQELCTARQGVAKTPEE